jgi:hypothetical protein
MSPGVFTRVFDLIVNTIFKRFVVILLMYLISLLFVQLPTLWNFIMRLGKNDERLKIQKRIRAKITNPLDPSSPYRAVEVLDELRAISDEHVQTLADLPDYALQHHADKETLGVREILDVEDEKQSNGKIFKKVFLY